MSIQKKLVAAIIPVMLVGCGGGGGDTGSNSSPNSTYPTYVPPVTTPNTTVEDIDLKITFSGISNNEVIALGDDAEYERELTYTVTNIGSTALAGHLIGVSFFLSKDADVTPNDIGIRTLDFNAPPQLLAGQSQTYTTTMLFESNLLTAGEYYIGAYVDIPNFYKDYNLAALAEDDNFAYIEQLYFADTKKEDLANNASPNNPRITISGNNLAECIDDDFEPNDTAGQARSLTLDAPASEVNFCNDRADWFSFTAPYDGEFEIVTTSDIKEMFVFNSQGAVEGFQENYYTNYVLQGQAGQTYFLHAMPGFSSMISGTNTNYISVETFIAP